MLKIRNATRLEVDGIKFRSKLEAHTYKILKEAGIKADYEMHRFTLLPAFEFNGTKVRAITYLPDFVGDNFVIECKGYPNDAWKNREKLFKYYLSINNPSMKFYVVRTMKEVDNLVKILANDNK